MQFTGELDSIRYINFYYEDASTNREKALGWILLALNQKDELKKVMLEIFGNIPILQLYSKEESYLWANRKEILEAADIVQQKNLYNPCPLLDNFIEFGRKKEEKREDKGLMMLLENGEAATLGSGQDMPVTPTREEENHAGGQMDFNDDNYFTR